MVRPYLGGDDIVSTPDCYAQRWAIYFGDVPLSKAEEYIEAMAIVRERVYPERRNATDRVKREKWWQFKRHAKEVVSARRMLCHTLQGLIVSADLTTEEIRHRLSMQARHFAGLTTPVEYARWIEALAPKIIVSPESLTIHITADHLSKLAAVPPVNVAKLHTVPASISTKVTQEGNKAILTASVSFKPQRGKCEIIDGETGKAITARKTAPNPTLIQTIAQAEFWRAELTKYPDKSLQDITEQHGVKPAYVRRLLNAAYLAPAIKRSIFQGTQPARIQVQDLLVPRSLDWKEQLRDLGFENEAVA